MKQRRKRGMWLVLLVLLAAGGIGLYTRQRPAPHVMEPPALTPALEETLLAAIVPGWPDSKPVLAMSTGAESVVAGRIGAIAAADTDGDGVAEWGVTYALTGAGDDQLGRATQPGFAVLKSGDKPALLFAASSAGGWEGISDVAFANAAEADLRVEAVMLSAGEIGFLSRHTVETTVGGRMTQGRARLFSAGLGPWGQAWEGETDHRWRFGHADEMSRSAVVRIEDRDGDGQAEVVTTPSFYYRRLDANDRGPHFMSDGPGDLIHRRDGALYTLSGLSTGPGTPEIRLRPAAPLYALRAPGPVAIDGDISDWDREELAVLSGQRFDEVGLLKYKRRDRGGMEDFSGEVQLMWDTTHLYVKAMVQDNTVVPGPGGKQLYEGDHLALWLDMDLAKDFGLGTRNQDDWQIGLTPGVNGPDAEAFVWVPKAGRHGIQAASRPLRDPYSGGLRGYQLEASVPWAVLGGLPVGTKPAPEARAMAAQHGSAPRTYHLSLAGVAGIGLVLSDSDTEYQELVFVSNPGFVWAQPTTFNSLLLVEAK